MAGRGLVRTQSRAGWRWPSERQVAHGARLFAPIWVPLVVVGGALLSGSLGSLFGALDHCATDTHLHHLCLHHPPHFSGHWLGHSATLISLAGLGGAGVLTIVRLVVLRRQTQALLAISRQTELGEDVRVLEQQRPAAMTIGWPRPVILLSRGLLEGVSRTTLSVILAHERAHVARHDTLSNVLDRLMAACYPRKVRAALLEGLILAREQICDDLAAKRLGCPLTVARALTEVARLNLPTSAIGVAMSVAELEARVVYLIAPRGKTRTGLGVPLGLLLLFGLGPGHVLLEWCVTFLLH